MSIKSAATIIAAVTAATVLGFAPTAALATDVVATPLLAAPASARPAPDPDRHPAPTPTCPTRPDIARQMRGYGMSAAGAKNIAEFAYRDCIHATSRA
jgi:hypothetical protein